MWKIQWNADRTIGTIWRIKDAPGFPKAPCQEGIIKKGKTHE